MKESNKRTAARQEGKLPVKLKGVKGITRDFSSSGIFFEADRSFSLGQPIEFSIMLEYADPEGPVEVKCRGEIIRVEENGQKIGVAATIDTYSFLFAELPNDQS